MSVINQMLKDLEKNEQKTGNASDLTTPESNNKSNRLLWLFILLLLLVLSYFINQIYFNGEASNNKTPASNQAINTLKIPSDNKATVINRSVASKDTQNQKTNQPAPKISKPPVKAAVAKQTKKKQSEIQSTTSSSLNPKKQGARPLASSNPKAVKPAKPVNKTINNPIRVKKLSKRNLANKEYQQLARQWSALDKAEQIASLDHLVMEFGDFTSLWYKVLSFLQNQNSDLFDRYLSLALTQHPNDTPLLMRSARRFFVQQNYSAALSSVNKSNPDLWQGRDHRFVGLVYQKNKLYRQSIDYFKKSLSFNLKPGEVNMAMAISLQAIEEHNQALARFIEALKDPQLSPIQRQFIEQQIAAYQE